MARFLVRLRCARASLSRVNIPEVSGQVKGHGPRSDRACPWRSQPALSATLQGNFFSRRRLSSNRGLRRLPPHILGGQETHRGSRVSSEAEARTKGREEGPGLPGPAAPNLSRCLQRPCRLFLSSPIANAVADILEARPGSRLIVLLQAGRPGRWAGESLGEGGVVHGIYTW